MCVTERGGRDLRPHESGSLSDTDIAQLGLRAVGSDVTIHRSVLFFGASHVSIGSHVRIDAQAIVSGGPEAVVIGDYVHIAVGCLLFGGAGITLESFGNFSARTVVYSVSDDYVGGAMAGPMVPPEFRNVIAGRVVAERHVIVGAGSVVLPGVRLGKGASVGALTLVDRDVPPFEVVAGIPWRRLARRDADRLLDNERRLLAREASDAV